jgi:hypothetical protein
VAIQRDVRMAIVAFTPSLGHRPVRRFPRFAEEPGIGQGRPVCVEPLQRTQPAMPRPDADSITPPVA